MSTDTTTETENNLARLVPESERPDFLPRLFGNSLMIIGENTVYTFMTRLAEGYGGGFWDFKEGRDGALYMCPSGLGEFAMAWHGNGYAGTMSNDAAGITATLFALSHMSMVYRNHDRLAEAYHALLDLAASHPESGEIFRAID
jgi:hypothetical protein